MLSNDTPKVIFSVDIPAQEHASLRTFNPLRLLGHIPKELLRIEVEAFLDKTCVMLDQYPSLDFQPALQLVAFVLRNVRLVHLL